MGYLSNHFPTIFLSRIFIEQDFLIALSLKTSQQQTRSRTSIYNYSFSRSERNVGSLHPPQDSVHQRTYNKTKKKYESPFPVPIINLTRL